MTRVVKPEPPPKRVHRQARWQTDRLNNALGRLAEHNLEQIIADAQQWSPGIRAASLDPRVSGTRTPTTPVDRPAEPDWYTTILNRVEETVAALNQLDRVCRELTRPATPPRERAVTVAACQACGRVIGTASHPAKRGMCEACHKWTSRRRAEAIDAGAHPPDHVDLVRARITYLQTIDNR